MGVSSWGFLQNTSPHHQRHPVKKWISLKCHFFQHVNLGKSCRGPCNSLPSALPHLPWFSTACVSSQHLVKGNPKRQEWGKSAAQQPVPGTSCHFYTHTHTHTHTQMRSFSLQECPQAMGGLLKVDQVRKDLRNWSDSSSLLPQPGYSCLCPNPPGTQGWLPCVTHMGASPIRLLPVFPWHSLPFLWWCTVHSGCFSSM